ncbi:MAG: hypothetical protein PHD01_14270 [Geobacteraceae bacterium]|nr:hypothetical protein [Geobacteraceae bacterium]
MNEKEMEGICREDNIAECEEYGRGFLTSISVSRNGVSPFREIMVGKDLYL